MFSKWISLIVNNNINIFVSLQMRGWIIIFIVWNPNIAHVTVIYVKLSWVTLQDTHPKTCFVSANRKPRNSANQAQPPRNALSYKATTKYGNYKYTNNKKLHMHIYDYVRAGVLYSANQNQPTRDCAVRPELRTHTSTYLYVCTKLITYLGGVYRHLKCKTTYDQKFQD